jgi:hypothetical protein
MTFILPSFGASAISAVPGGGGGFPNTYSLDFDGTDDYVSTGLDVGGASALTVSAWVKHDDLTATSPNLLNQYAGGGSNRAFRFSMYAGTASWQGLRLDAYTSDGIKEANYSLNPVISTDTWYHAAFVFDGTSIKVYYNGDNSQSSATATWSNAATLNNNGVQVLIGGGSGVGTYTNGKIDEVGIWTSALSASDITAIYNSGVPTDISSYSPVLYYRMGDNDGGTGTTITDQGSGGNDGTLTNGPTFSTDVPS